MPRTCGAMGVHASAVEKEIGYALLRRQIEVARSAARRGPLETVARIPVVVHIVQHEDDARVSDNQVHEQVAVLNRDFRAANADRLPGSPDVFHPLIADALIEFALARQDSAGRPTNGILRKRTTAGLFPEAPGNEKDHLERIDREVKVLSPAWPSADYLNVWVCNMGRNPLGYATFPGAAAWRDGIVIDVTCFGKSGTAAAPFNRGRTLTHEVGHWLDLLHIWGDDGGACHRSDNIADTPNQGGPNYNVPSYPRISCNNHPHGDLFMNFMDYVDDEAMVMFTHGQALRMQETIQGPRSSLLRSRGLLTPTNPISDTEGAVIARAAFGGALYARNVFDGVTWIQA